MPRTGPGSLPIGPDVTGGNLGNLNGRANSIPCQDCFSTVMKGPADGSGNPLSFNAGDCYGKNNSVKNAIPGINGCPFEARSCAGGSVLLTFHNPNKDARIRLYSAAGRMVMTLANIRTGSAELTPAHLARGVYALELCTNGKVLRQRICLTK